GVDDVPASARFYEALGFKRKFRATGDEIAFFDGGGVVFAVWGWKNLADDATEADQPRPKTFRGTTLAWNCRTHDEVDVALGTALRAGERWRRKGSKTDCGGYGVFFSDPDGYWWEVLQARVFDSTDDGRLFLRD